MEKLIQLSKCMLGHHDHIPEQLRANFFAACNATMTTALRDKLQNTITLCNATLRKEGCSNISCNLQHNFPLLSGCDMRKFVRNFSRDGVALQVAERNCLP